MDLEEASLNIDKAIYKYIYEKGYQDALDFVKEAAWAAQEREFDNAHAFSTVSDYSTDYGDYSEYTYTTDYSTEGELDPELL